MIGNNKLILNEATMIAALQHYFDTVLFAEGKAPEVGGIDKSSNSNYDSTFTVSVKNDE